MNGVFEKCFAILLLLGNSNFKKTLQNSRQKNEFVLFSNLGLIKLLKKIVLNGKMINSRSLSEN